MRRWAIVIGAAFVLFWGIWLVGYYVTSLGGETPGRGYGDIVSTDQGEERGG